MRAMTGVWRWRRNELCRGSDLVEAWVALCAAVLIVLGGLPVGWAVGRIAHKTLLSTVEEQRAHRHLVRVTVDRLVTHPPLDPDPETASNRDAHRRVMAHWTGRDGSEHSGRVPAPRAVERGDTFRVWTDDRGRLTPRPMDAPTAGNHAVLAGLGAAAGAAGLVEGARRLVVWSLAHRRYRRWDQEWERAGQDWGRAGAGS